MRHPCILPAMFTLALLGNVAQAQSAAASSSPHASSIHVKGPHGTPMTPIYQDAKGGVIDEQSFVKATQQGRHFNIKPSGTGNTMILALLPAGAKGGNHLTSTRNPGLRIGKPMPAFTLRTVGGGRISKSMLAGKATLVDFFFADCVACIEELPALNAYASQHPDMHFLAITFDDAGTAKAFVKDRHFTWLVAYNGKPLVDKLAITSFPTLLLLDRNGRLLASNSGSIPVSITQPPASSATPSPSVPSASVTKNAQLQWLDHWVNEHRAAHTD